MLFIMNTKLTSMILALAMCVSMGVPALAADTATAQAGVAEVTVAPLKSTFNDTNIYRQVLLSETPVVENGIAIGTIRLYQFVPLVQTMAITNYSQFRKEFLSVQGVAYVWLDGYFMYDGTSVTCYDSSVTHTLTGFEEISRTTTGNGTNKSTLKLSYSYKSGGGALTQRSLSLWCDKSGGNNGDKV